MEFPRGTDARNLTNRLERVEIEDRQPRRDCRHRGRLVGGRNRARRASRNIQPPNICAGQSNFRTWLSIQADAVRVRPPIRRVEQPCKAM